MGASVVFTGPVSIDSWKVQPQVFTGTGDGTVQTFLLDLSGLGTAKVLGVTAICLSSDGSTLYPASATLGTFVVPPLSFNPGALVQVPTGVDFTLTITFTACN